MEHLRLLAALPRLTVLNLHRMTWAEDAISAGPTLLATSLPRLRVLNVPDQALVCSMVHATVPLMSCNQCHCIEYLNKT